MYWILYVKAKLEIIIPKHTEYKYIPYWEFSRIYLQSHIQWRTKPLWSTSGSANQWPGQRSQPLVSALRPSLPTDTPSWQERLHFRATQGQGQVG